MKERVILHSDINHCFAQIEEMMYPELRNVPMAVGGSVEKRSGIILARNQLAKAKGVTTAETIWQAEAKCPGILIVPPHYDQYKYYSEKVKDIYLEFSDKVESFGIDEAWIDLTDSVNIFGDKEYIAKTIQARVLEELGLTVSIGVSFNKVFAKLGSDMIKPYGLVIIDENNYQDIVWRLPAEDLLNVGPKTREKLNAKNIFTIGDIANSSICNMTNLLGVHGEQLWMYANGMDSKAVADISKKRKVKSVSNGITTAKDMKTVSDLKLVFTVLAESVASRLKEIRSIGKTISINIRFNDLSHFSKQMKFDEPTNTSEIIMEYVMKLLVDDRVYRRDIRSIGVRISNLVDDSYSTQLNLFEDMEKLHTKKLIDITMDNIRNKYGHNSVKKLIVLCDEELTDFNPKGDHVIFPIGY